MRIYSFAIRTVEILVDMEKAMMNAIDLVFDGTIKVKGCAFHFSQALLRKVGAIGLKKKYCTNSIESLIVRLTKALIFLKAEDVKPTFNEIKLLAVDEGLTQTEMDILGLFFKYMEKYYFSATAPYPIEFWNHFDEDKDRTSNRVEGFHRGFSFDKRPKPDIFKFIGDIKKEQIGNENEMSALENGANLHKKELRAYIENNVRIHNLTQLYKDKLIATPLEFLRRVEVFYGSKL